MSDKQKQNNSGHMPILKENGRSLPPTSTKTPMPPVKNPKPAETGKKS